MAEEVKISFILPIYNVGDYLRECFDSICTQIHGACEVIAVDDGATDGSGSVCDEYAEKYPFVRVVHKVNGGLSSARNAGMAVATGRYLAFVDADDRLAPGSVRSILEWIDGTDADICFMQAEKFYPDGHLEDMGDRIDRKHVAGLPALEALKYLASRPKFPGSACSKLYRRDFLETHDLHFPYDRRYSEDLGFARDCLLKAQKFDALHIPYYEYRKGREGSITSVRAERNFWDLSLFVQESVDLLTEDRQEKDRASGYAMSFVAYEYSVLLWYCSSFAGEAKKKAYAFLKQYRWVLRYGVTGRIKLIRVLSASIGLRCTSMVLDLYMHLRALKHR